MPYFFLSFAGALLALLALLHRDRLDRVVVRRMVPSTMSERTRLLLGQGVGALGATILLLAGRISGAHVSKRLMFTLLALMVYLYVGWVVPRRGRKRAITTQHAIRRQTPSFTSYIRISVAGADSPMVLLERYVAVPEPRYAAMQAVVRDALLRIRSERRRPFEALLSVAREVDCRELIDVVEALAQAEEQGTDPRPALQSHQVTLQAVLRDERTRLLKRRNLMLTVMVALSVMVGVLGNLLYIMVFGAVRQQGLF